VPGSVPPPPPHGWAGPTTKTRPPRTRRPIRRRRSASWRRCRTGQRQCMGRRSGTFGRWRAASSSRGATTTTTKPHPVHGTWHQNRGEAPSPLYCRAPFTCRKRTKLMLYSAWPTYGLVARRGQLLAVDAAAAAPAAAPAAAAAAAPAAPSAAAAAVDRTTTRSPHLLWVNGLRPEDDRDGFLHVECLFKRYQSVVVGVEAGAHIGLGNLTLLSERAKRAYGNAFRRSRIP
jgi:hypothetical protein